MCNELKKRTLKVAKVAHPENTFSLHSRKRGICIWFADNLNALHNLRSLQASSLLIASKFVGWPRKLCLHFLIFINLSTYFYYISHVAHVFPKDSPQFFFTSLLGDKQNKLLLSQCTQTYES